MTGVDAVRPRSFVVGNAPPSNDRTDLFLRGPIVPPLMRLSWPNILVMLAQASTGLVETWWISRLGTDALAGMAVVFPVVMLMQYLLGPLVFGIGGTLVTVVGMNIGAGQPRHALGIAFIGGAAAFALTESIGVAAAVWPEAWLRLFDSNPAMLASGSAYLRTVGPFYGF
jgi:Na+-driven multidrug efflux pump